jgi:hypothetical protein
MAFHQEDARSLEAWNLQQDLLKDLMNLDAKDGGIAE